MVEKSGMSKSKWIAELIREKIANSWPENVKELAGTWKDFPTAEEIRSDLLIISTFFSMGSQVFRMQLLSTSLFFVPDLLMMISFVLIGVGIINPWYKKDEAKPKQVKDAEISVPV